jgi:hypothetical protein
MKGSKEGMNSNGMFGIKSVHEDGMFLTSRQMRLRAATRFMKREGQLWIKIFPDKPITKKLLRYVWVKVKVQLSGLPLLNQLCLKLEVPWLQGVTSCGSKASSKNLSLLEISKHNLYYVKSEINLSAAELQSEKTSRNKMLTLFLQ